MPNIHGLNDKKDDVDPDDERFQGGTDGRGGGSGMSVIDPRNGGGGGGDPYAGMKGAASQAGSEDTGVPMGQKITLYANGFTVDDGPFRALDDPANAAFVASMNQGQVPEELRPPGAAPGDINVRLEDKSGEDYKAPPPPAYTAYSGEGQSVGGAAEVAAGALVSAGAGSGVAPVVDPAQPTTTMMIRLATGKRLKATLNLTHTVGDLQALLSAEGAAAGPYVLMAGFPPAQLTDAALTIEVAGLKGAQITQKRV